MMQNLLKSFAREHRWVILAALFFVIWKVSLLGIMWEGRAIAPEPDDSFEYIAQIASVSECTAALTCPYPGVSMLDHSGFAYLSYRIFFGTIGRLSGLAPDTIFHLGFFFGILILPLVLIVFLRSFTANQKLIAWSIVFLAFYHGTGETHGFYWVVPSFFSALLFFLLFAYVVRDHSLPHWAAGLLAAAFTFTHPMSVYLAVLLPLSVLGSALLSGTWDWKPIKRMLAILCIIVLGASFQAVYLGRLSQTNYYGLGKSLEQATSSMRDIALGSDSKESVLSGYNLTTTGYANLLRQRVDAMNIAYFRYVLPHWTALFPLLLVLLILYKKKYFQLLSLYLSAFAFFVGATLLNEYGFRSAIILWPLTFIVYAFGSWHILEYVGRITNPLLRRFSYLAIGLGICLFFTLNAILAITYNSNLNMRHKYSIDPMFATYIESRLAPDEKVALNNILIRTPGGARLFLSQRVTSPNANPQYLVLIGNSGAPTDPQSHPRVIALSRWIMDTLEIHITRSPEQSLIRPPEGYSLEKTFGAVKIYRRDS